jgi:hypothetical protein
MRRLKSMRTPAVICLRKAPRLPLVGYRLGVCNRVNVCRFSFQHTCQISMSPNCSAARHCGTHSNFMNMATKCHGSAVLLCLQGNMAHGVRTIGAKRSDSTSCSLDTKKGGRVYFLGGRSDHLSPSVSEVKNVWVLPPLPHASFGTVLD